MANRKRKPAPQPGRSRAAESDVVPETADGSAGRTGGPSSGKKLTTKREQFARLIAISRYTATDAYLEAYGQGNSTMKTINEAACRLRAVPEVAERIEQLQERLLTAHLDEGALTLAQHLRELGALQALAVELQQVAPAIQAAHYRGKASGLYIEKTQNATSSLEELVAGTASDRKSASEHDSGRPVKASARERGKRR